MSKNTSILLGNHFEEFVPRQVKPGTKKQSLNKKLKKGERSGFLADFDGDAFLKDLHRKHVRKG